MATSDYLRAFILRGKNRLLVLKTLRDGEKTQAQLHHETGLYRSHVTRTLSELKGKGLVKCLNPKDRIYKLYVLTEKGQALLKMDLGCGS